MLETDHVATGAQKKPWISAGFGARLPLWLAGAMAVALVGSVAASFFGVLRARRLVIQGQGSALLRQLDLAAGRPPRRAGVVAFVERNRELGVLYAAIVAPFGSLEAGTPSTGLPFAPPLSTDTSVEGLGDRVRIIRILPPPEGPGKGRPRKGPHRKGRYRPPHKGRLRAPGGPPIDGTFRGDGFGRGPPHPPPPGHPFRSWDGLGPSPRPLGPPEGIGRRPGVSVDGRGSARVDLGPPVGGPMERSARSRG